MVPTVPTVQSPTIPIYANHVVIHRTSSNPGPGGKKAVHSNRGLNSLKSGSLQARCYSLQTPDARSSFHTPSVSGGQLLSLLFIRTQPSAATDANHDSLVFGNFDLDHLFLAGQGCRI